MFINLITLLIIDRYPFSFIIKSLAWIFWNILGAKLGMNIVEYTKLLLDTFIWSPLGLGYSVGYNAKFCPLLDIVGICIQEVKSYPSI